MNSDGTKIKRIKEKERVCGVSDEWFYLIRYIAMLIMTLAYLSKIFCEAGLIPVKLYYGFRVAGLTAYPLFAFELIESFFHTKSKRKHLLDLLILAVVSEFPYDVFFVDNPKIITEQIFNRTNAVVTLLLSFFCLMITNELQNNGFKKVYKKERIRKIAVTSLGLIVCMIGMYIANQFTLDFEEAGVALIFLFYLARKSKHVRVWQGVAVTVFILMNTYNKLLYVPCLLSLVLIYVAETKSRKPFKNEAAGEKLTSRTSRFICKIYYPLSLVVLAVLRIIVL